MSERRYQESSDDWEDRECQESIRAEPSWTDIEASKAWLEERYPLLDDASLGSPLFRYMRACVKDPNHMEGRAPIFLASMLSFHESIRYLGETGLTVGFDPKQEKLYPDYGFLNQDCVPEPNWSDEDASRAWLEQLYPLGPASLGSPLYRYMQACRESRHQMCSPMTHLGSMLTDSEWTKFCTDYPNSARHRRRDKPDLIVLYPEYGNRMWPNQGPGRKFTDHSHFSPGWPHITSLPPPAASTAMFSESYPPHLRRQSQSSSPFNKRKGVDGDDISSEYLTNKKQRKRSDLSGGVVMSTKPRNPYKGHDGRTPQNDLRSMPPPPRPQQNAANAKLHAGTTKSAQQRNSGEEGSSSSQETINVMGTPPRLTHRLVEARKYPRLLEINRQPTETQTADAARQNDQSAATLKTCDPVQISAVATKTPARGHNGSMFTGTKPQHGQEPLEMEFYTGDLGHQPRAQHTSSRTVQNDKNAAHAPANKSTSLLRPDPQLEDQAQAEENSDAMDKDSDSFKHQKSASPPKIPLVDPSRKRGIEGVDDEQPASSPYKKMRVSSDTCGDEPLVSSPPVETPLVEFSRKSSIEDVEDALPTSSPSESRQIPSSSGGDEPLTSSPFTETPRADPSRKRSIEDVEGAPPTTSSPKRKRTSPNPGGSEVPLSSPFDPLERSTHNHFPRLKKIPIEDRSRGRTTDPAPLRQESPSCEDPNTVIYRPNDVEVPALKSGSQTDATDAGRNPNGQPTAHFRDRGAALNGSSETQKPGNDGPVPPEPESQGENHIHVKEDSDDMVIDSENPRDQTTIHVMHNGGDRTVQTAISVVIPVQIPQRQVAANQEHPPEGDSMNVPVTQRKRKGGRKLGPNGRNAPQSEPRRKPPTKDRKNRQSKPERQQQTYVGRLRPGVGERKHKKPSK